MNIERPTPLTDAINERQEDLAITEYFAAEDVQDRPVVLNVMFQFEGDADELNDLIDTFYNHLDDASGVGAYDVRINMQTSEEE